MPRFCLLLKPDAFRTPGIGEAVLLAYRLNGFTIARSRHELTLTPAETDRRRALFQAHYAEHNGKDFFDSLVEEMAQGPVQAYELSHNCPQSGVRAREVMAGLRTAYSLNKRHNTLHMSDSAKAAERELQIWFGG